MNQKKNEDIISKKKKLEREKVKLEIKLIKSLDKKALNDLKSFERHQSEPKIKLREEFAVKSNSQGDYLKILGENNEIMSKINKDLEFYEFVEKENLKSINPMKYKGKIQKHRKPITDNFQPHKSMDHFIKIDKSGTSTFNQLKRNNFISATSTNK
jgi:hypothetical protein